MSFGGKQRRRRHGITVVFYRCCFILFGSDYSREVGARDLSLVVFSQTLFQ